MPSTRRILMIILVAVLGCSIFAQAQTPQKSDRCSSQPEYKQFDFWVGEWQVSDKDEQIGTSSIQSIVNGCVIWENYFQKDGFTGKSVNFFDATLRKWRQTWVDGRGNVSEFVGEYKDGAMRFEGESHRPDGARILRRMILYNLGPTRVRHYSERSIDGGKTWTIFYDFTYTRKN